MSLGTWSLRRAKRSAGTSGPPAVAQQPTEAVGEAASPTDPTDSNGRFSSLLLAAEAVRRPRTERDIRKILQFVGMLAIALGFLAIGLGWYGAAHSGYQYEETPFLISGGILGLGLILTGGVLVRSAWSLREIEEARRNAANSHRDALAIVESIRTLQRALDGDTEELGAPVSGMEER
jgi:hypothetical protein